ncbi:hypothetical protein VM1G_11979 [Cytospora mali]|uniref:Uncharacterized protein n=1 Tax=Cytospora mali TaxID=578113 RepID=A0A194WDR9_CYTMA|nr:hypothetical protein VM1G_11979 [Valsa mali]
MRKEATRTYPSAGDSHDAGDKPQPRTVTLILRLIEFLLTGVASGLAFWMLLKKPAVPAGGGTSASLAAVFIICAALLGVASAASGISSLCYKFDFLEALEPRSMRFGRFHYIPVYIGFLYLIIGTVGSWASISLFDTPPLSTEQAHSP